MLCVPSIILQAFQRQWLLALLVVLSLSSCDKNDTPEPQPQEGPILKLKKMAWSENDFIAFQYNSQGLPTRYTSQWVYILDGSGSTKTSVTDFTYNQNNQMVLARTNNRYLNKYYYQGNALEKMEEYDAKDQLVITHSYAFEQAKLKQMVDSIRDPYDGSIGVLKRTYEYDTRGNLSVQKEYRLDSDTQLFQLTSSTHYEGFDERKNVENFLAFAPFLPQVRLFVNNPSKKVVKGPDGADVQPSQSYAYEYSPDGYPTKKVTRIPVGQSAPAVTATYEYE